MAEDADADTLGPNSADYVASAARAALGAVPFVGSLLNEIAGTVIPNQRIERIVRFATELSQRLETVEQASIRAHLVNENFTDLMEEGLRQAARSTTDERKRYIADLIARSLTSEDVSFIESKHLLRLLGEINDVEVIWLRFYQSPTQSGDEDFRIKHADVLRPVAAHQQSPRSEIDKETLQQSYKQHLQQLGLLRERYRIDPKTKVPELETNGRPKLAGYELTRLGRLLLRQVGLIQSDI